MKRTRPADEEAKDTPAENEDVTASTTTTASSSQASAHNRNFRLALGTMPSAEMYERSYMHRDHVTHVVVTSTDFIVTASRDGQIKFWKKMQKGLEFVKHFRAHLAPISCVAVSHDGTMLATTAADKAFKVFDVLSFDMINWVKLDFIPGGDPASFPHRELRLTHSRVHLPTPVASCGMKLSYFICRPLRMGDQPQRRGKRTGGRRRRFWQAGRSLSHSYLHTLFAYSTCLAASKASFLS